MKNLKFIGLLALVTVLIISCSKEKRIKNKINGNWEVYDSSGGTTALPIGTKVNIIETNNDTIFSVELIDPLKPTVIKKTNIILRGDIVFGFNQRIVRINNRKFHMEDMNAPKGATYTKMKK